LVKKPYPHQRYHYGVQITIEPKLICLNAMLFFLLAEMKISSSTEKLYDFSTIPPIILLNYKAEPITNQIK